MSENSIKVIELTKKLNNEEVIKLTKKLIDDLISCFNEENEQKALGKAKSLLEQYYANFGEDPDFTQVAPVFREYEYKSDLEREAVYRTILRVDRNFNSKLSTQLFLSGIMAPDGNSLKQNTPTSQEQTDSLNCSFALKVAVGIGLIGLGGALVVGGVLLGLGFLGSVIPTGGLSLLASVPVEAAVCGAITLGGALATAGWCTLFSAKSISRKSESYENVHSHVVQ